MKDGKEYYYDTAQGCYGPEPQHKASPNTLNSGYVFS